MFGQSQPKTHLRYYEQTLSNFSTTLQPLEASTDHTVSHYLPPCQLVCCQRYPKISSFFWIFLCRKSSLTKTTGSWCFLLKKYLIVVNLSHISLSLNHSIKYVCCWQKNEGARNKLLPPMKTLLLLLTKSPNARKFCSSYCYLSFVRFFRFLILVY